MKSIKQGITPQKFTELLTMSRISDDVAQQTLSAVIYSMHLAYMNCSDKYRKKKVKELYNNIKSILEMPNLPQGQLTGTELIEFACSEYNINLNEIHLQVETPREYMNRKKGIK